jgi:hypothetical protein
MSFILRAIQKKYKIEARLCTLTHSSRLGKRKNYNASKSTLRHMKEPCVLLF